MKVGEVRRYVNQWHCGLHSEVYDPEVTPYDLQLYAENEIAHINRMEPFLILTIESKYNDKEWAKVLFNGKIGYVVASDELTEIVI